MLSEHRGDFPGAVVGAVGDSRQLHLIDRAVEETSGGVVFACAQPQADISQTWAGVGPVDVPPNQGFSRSVVINPVVGVLLSSR